MKTGRETRIIPVLFKKGTTEDYNTETKLAGSGIGRACALLLAKEGVSKLMVADLSLDAARNTLAECEAVATNAQFRGQIIEVDVTQEESVSHLFGEAAKAFGRIDYCVNSAGVSDKPVRRMVKVTVLTFSLLLIDWGPAGYGHRQPFIG